MTCRAHTNPGLRFPCKKVQFPLQFPLLADEGAGKVCGDPSAGTSRLASRIPGWGFPAPSAARNKSRRVPDFCFHSYIFSGSSEMAYFKKSSDFPC